MSELKDTRVVFNCQGRPVGRIASDGFLEKTGLDPSVHRLRKPEGWATDAAHLDIEGLAGVRLITKAGEVWEAPIALWRRYGIPLERGFGRQIVLPSRYWQVRRPGEVQARQLPLALGV